MIKRKPKGPTARARAAKSRKLVIAERVNKEKVRLRDRQCRFPMCGCKNLRIPCSVLKRVPTVSHDEHKGMGGDPTGERSQPHRMLLLCKWRHQDAPVSRHAGTIETVYLTEKGNDGPLEWRIDLGAVYPGQYRRHVWFVLAREIEPGVVGALTPQQCDVLDTLAEMER